MDDHLLLGRCLTGTVAKLVTLYAIKLNTSIVTVFRYEMHKHSLCHSGQVWLSISERVFRIVSVLPEILLPSKSKVFVTYKQFNSFI